MIFLLYYNIIQPCMFESIHIIDNTHMLNKIIYMETIRFRFFHLEHIMLSLTEKLSKQ